MSEPSTESRTNAAPFPPQEIGAFLRFCAGEWMGLRSRFALDAGLEGENGDEWHSSERGELLVAYLEPETADAPGGLQVGPKDGTAQELQFSADGSFRNGDQQGRWQLWPDGSLELSLSSGNAEVRERIWFTKPNLRLRSTVESRADGSPGRACFSSEIRRVSRPAEPSS
ncbi:phycobiliprotein lyase [Cyanobium sp. ATX 6E8]|uniref:phycobiliprotein lyase n=1 Tax=Cyanobium sp. ATX 6E8 TaxID=2823701 RepID=UPI0020CDB871|nr:phycobiliprotein lyase [Cyanobium sp. ATX 6E8]MCP9943080.1 phycobiliprotein lyase [Cyanobium sp. ATX 6E8]